MFTENYYRQLELNNQSAKLFSGKALSEWPKTTVLWILTTYFKPTEWLDFGCGPATAYREGSFIHDRIFNELGGKAILYDPAVPELSHLDTDRTYKGVISIDVLEHIPDTDTHNVLDMLFGLCEEWMFLFISTKPTSGKLVDNSLAHITIKTREEWVEIISEYADKYKISVVLGTDYPGYREHKGGYFTYDDWNMTEEYHDLMLNQYSEFATPALRECTEWKPEEIVFR